MRRDALQDWLRYARKPAAFVDECVYIYDATGRDWVRFALWPAQVRTLAAMAAERKLVILKARQLGITWLCLSYALWLLIFRAPATVLLFSLREEEAKELLWRLRGMYERLPLFLRARAATHSNETRWILSNGSRALAFSTRAGRSYTGTLALVDEADFVPDLARFLNAVKPTIDGGGQLFLVSTADKKHPQSTFKRLFWAAGDHAQAGGEYRRVFLPWYARPGRDEAWRSAVQAEMFAQRGTHDDFYAEYPATAEEALAAEQLDRRLPWEWVKGCLSTNLGSELNELNEGCQRILGSELNELNELNEGCQRISGSELNELNELNEGCQRILGSELNELNELNEGCQRISGSELNELNEGCQRILGSELNEGEQRIHPVTSSPRHPLTMSGLTVWERPVPGRRYVIGVDPAEGNPHSDESAACVLDAETWAQVAELAGRVEPSAFAGQVDELGRWFNGAAVLVERNNHGHLVLRELERLGRLPLLRGYDGRVGWLSNVKGKPLLYGLAADALRAGACTIRSGETAAQLASIEASTLRAPAGLHDDRADAFALAIAGLAWQAPAVGSALVEQADPLGEYDAGGW